MGLHNRIVPTTDYGRKLSIGPGGQADGRLPACRGQAIYILETLPGRTEYGGRLIRRPALSAAVPWHGVLHLQKIHPYSLRP
jgi:hypothetical protein